MTTLVVLNTRDAIVMGSDSLGTVTRSLVDPTDLAEYFDTTNGLKIRVGQDGFPLLDELSKITRKSHEVPCAQMTHVDKIYSLSPLEMGIMSAGVASIGDRSIKNLVSEFKYKDRAFRGNCTNYTLKSVGQRLLDFLWQYYSKQYTDEHNRPELEVMLCGYDKHRFTPGMMRIYVHQNKMQEPDYDFGVFFGGQTREIQRVTFGTDVYNRSQLADRASSLLKKYKGLITERLAADGIQANLPEPESFGDDLKLFHNWSLEGFTANWGAFSEQNAIECVDFLVNIMIRSQQFSTHIPSVGGNVQISVIKKNAGFTYVSRREWRHGDYAVAARE